MTLARGKPAALSAWVIGILVAVAVLLRLIGLGREGLWCDEAYTALSVRLPIAEMLRTLASTDDAPPFFYLITKPILALAGDSEFALRALPAAAGVIAVLLLLLYARRRADSAAAWAGAFFAVAAYGLFYARQGRSYSVILCLALMVILAAREQLRGSRRAGPCLAVSGLLLCLTHHVGAILIGTSLLLWPLRADRSLRPARWLLWHAIPLGAWLIWWLASSAQLATHADLNQWMAEFWRSRSLALAPLLSLAAFTPAALPAAYHSVALPALGEASPLWPVLSALLAVLCLVAALCAAAGSGEERRAVLTEAAFLLLPLVALAGASLLWTPIYVLGRTDAIAYPAFVLLIGRGLARLRRGWAAGILLFWTALSILMLGGSYGLFDAGAAKGADRRLAREMVARGLQPGDWVIHTYLTAPTLEYYLDRWDAPHRTAFFPASAGENIAGVRAYLPVDSLAHYLNEARALRRTMEREMPPTGAAWILGQIDPDALPAAAGNRPLPAVRVQQIGYPISVLAYALIGNQPIPDPILYRQDWVSGQRVLLRIPRGDWLAPEALPAIRTAPLEEVGR